MIDAILSVGASTLRMSTPLILAAMGGLLSERSGVINIALEGHMIVGAFVSAAVTLATGSPVLGLLAAGFCATVFAALYATSVIQWKANQIVAGMAMNMLAAGLTPFLCKVLYDSAGSTPSIDLSARLGVEVMVGTWALVLALEFWMRKTPSGLWLSFAGEHPSALEAAGVRVLRVRWSAVLAAGFLAGVAGASLALYLSSGFTRGMTAARGFMAIAALIFGKWRPLPTAAACLLFGFSDALQIRLQGVILWGTEPVPVQFIQILPYIVTILVLAGWVGVSRPPRSLGTPFIRH